ncbi:MAG: hypothetical protein R2824_18480 [Saprospiraceae bacterium]
MDREEEAKSLQGKQWRLVRFGRFRSRHTPGQPGKIDEGLEVMKNYDKFYALTIRTLLTNALKSLGLHGAYSKKKDMKMAQVKATLGERRSSLKAAAEDLWLSCNRLIINRCKSQPIKVAVK